MTPTITRWDGCYRDAWQDLIVPEAFAHPAKYSRGLIHRIYQHLLERGYVRPGQTVLDPFGGASLGAIDAATYGLQWIGVELEENFRIISHKNMLLWSQERWCTCGDYGAAYVSALRHAVSADSRGGEQNTPGQERPVLLEGMSQPSLFHWKENQRGDTPEIPRTATVEQGQAVVASHESQALDSGEWGESQGGEERPLARGTVCQSKRLCGDTSQRQAEIGTPACDGADARTTAQAQRVGTPSQRRQNRQSSREPRTDDLQPAHAPSQSAGAPAPDTPGVVLCMRGDRRDTGNTGPDTNRLFLTHLQTRQAAGIRPSVTRSQTCQSCGKLAVPLPVLLQGDSRVLRQVLAGAQAGCVVGSPPYAESNQQYAENWQYIDRSKGLIQTQQRGQHADSQRAATYGHAPGQLGALPPGTPPDALVSSPPYAGAGQVLGTHNGIDWSQAQDGGKVGTPARIASGEGYGSTPGQLGNMAIVSSPPYAEGLSKEHTYTDHSKRDKDSHRRIMTEKGIVDPFYGVTPGNLGTEATTFWEAASQIVGECAALLPVGGIACWVVKDYISKGKRVPFCDQWRQLCESHGLVLIEEIHASLVEEHGTQEGLFGEAETLTTERKSFFRRLAERKGSPRIDHETVLILRKED